MISLTDFFISLIFIMNNTRKRKLNEISSEPLPERQPVTKRRKLDKHALIDYFELQVEEKAQSLRSKKKAKAQPGSIQFHFSCNDEKL